MRYSRVAALSFLVFAPELASAEPIWSTLQQIGRTGTWAANCWLSPSWRNHRVTLFRESDGAVKQRTDRGADGPSLTNVIEQAQILALTTLQIRLRNDDPAYGEGNGLVFDVIETIESNRRRTLQSKGSDGKEYIKDGIMIQAGQPSAWVSKCSD
jgi:hypothetical protein